MTIPYTRCADQYDTLNITFTEVSKTVCYGDQNCVLWWEERWVIVSRTVCYDEQNGVMLIITVNYGDTVCYGDQNGML
jgi:hypothetical protein